jgi:hypothetical protein
LTEDGNDDFITAEYYLKESGEIQERPSNNTGGAHQRNLRFFSTFPSTGRTRRFYNLKFCSPQVNQKIKKSHDN